MQSSSISNILYSLKSQFTQNKLLMFSIVISLLLHLLLLTKFSLTLPELDKSHQTLEMRLVKLQPTQNSNPTKKNDSTTTSLPSAINEAKVSEIPSDLPAGNDPITEQHINESNERYSPPPDTVPLNTQPADQQAISAPPIESTENVSPIEIGDDSEKTPSQVYQYVETEFEVIRGGDKSAAGTAHIKFSMQENKTYSIQSVTEARGLASLIFGKLVQTSEGATSEHGLRPNFYQYQYGDNEKKNQTANFAWSDGIIEMNSAKGKKIEPLVEGTQDLLSFMYQFMFTPPLETNEIMISNGKNLRTYRYIFQGEVLLKTKFGELNTIHLQKSGDDEEKTELWLAVDYQNLPVKIKKTEKDGSSIEQIAVRISTVTP